MKQILLIGAGRSTYSLINYLVEHLEELNARLKVVDLNVSDVARRYSSNDRVEIGEFNVKESDLRKKLISESDIIVSMLPARMHLEVAKDCISFKKSMVTASYVSEEMKALDNEAKKSGVLLLNEIGVDPGIDHLSAMQQIDEIREGGAILEEFETFTGGLVAPESDNNPWNYKFTWNPRNVVLAGSGGAVKFIQEGSYKYIPYHKLFRRTEIIEIDGFGKFEGYANRDSLSYRSIYGLKDIKTMYRGTLRRPGFCRAWNLFVQLGLTDDTYKIENSEKLTFRSFINLFLPYNPNDSVELKLKNYLKIDQDDFELFDKLKWLDIFKDIPVELKEATPAQILQKILMRKWKLDPEDKDMIVMWHKFVYRENEKKKERHSYMIIKGKSQEETAMAITVGLPVAIATRMILNGEIKSKGVQVPINKNIYVPVLKELKKYGVEFIEKEID